MSVGEIRDHLRHLADGLNIPQLIADRDHAHDIAARLTQTWQGSNSPQAESAIPAANAIPDHLSTAAHALTAATELLTTYAARL